MSANNPVAAVFALLLLAALAALPGPGIAADETLAREQFEAIIETRCTLCHTRERVDKAIAEGRNLQELQAMMLERGAVLTDRDKKVLGTFWGTPLKRKEPVPAQATTLREYRQIIETRCTECHTRERIDQAIARRLPFETVEEILLKRGVVLTEREKNVLGTFWGEPLKER